MAYFGTSENRFVLEVDGIAAIRASEISGLKIDHKETEIHEGNRPNPHLVRGNYSVGDITVKHAHALNQTGREFMRWLQDFMTGANIERRSFRLLVMNEDGNDVMEEYEAINCVPKSFEVEAHRASGTEGSYFKFMFRPEDMTLLGA